MCRARRKPRFYEQLWWLGWNRCHRLPKRYVWLCFGIQSKPYLGQSLYLHPFEKGLERNSRLCKGWAVYSTFFFRDQPENWSWPSLTAKKSNWEMPDNKSRPFWYWGWESKRKALFVTGNEVFFFLRKAPSIITAVSIYPPLIRAQKKTYSRDTCVFNINPFFGHYLLPIYIIPLVLSMVCVCISAFLCTININSFLETVKMFIEKKKQCSCTASRAFFC